MKRILFVCFFICNAVFAKDDTQTAALSGSTFTDTGQLIVDGSRFNGGAYVALDARSYWIENVYGLVKLSVPLNSVQPASGTAKAVVTIKYKLEDNGNFSEVIKENVALIVSVADKTATDAAYFLAPNAQHIEVKILSIENLSNLNGLTLEASVVTSSFDKMDAAATTAIPQNIAHNPVLTSGGSLPVTWNKVSGAELYELEWTYISNQDETPGAVMPFSVLKTKIPPYYFRNNSSRVEVTQPTGAIQPSYEIPLVYEKGYILYRVRAVGKNIVNSKVVWVKSNWTYLDNSMDLYPDVNAYLYDGLENNINWQSSLSFAEEGKNKVVVSYHDGSSRNRQAVTRINTDDRAIVGETFYDYNGRPIVQTLPVPVKKDSLGFYPHFNVVEGQDILHKEDIVEVIPDVCNPAGAKLSDKTGASNYYSTKNTFGTAGNTGDNIINKDLIPDAKKYPYSQMVYTPDNTGRIATQSGMGEANNLGSGHETKYMYGTPLQAELCRLFGNQVGYAAHYKKNSVIDPNGQVSVSYLDLDGKVVATALAGELPDNVSNLGNSNSRNINEDILKTNPMSNQLSADGTSKTFNKKIIVTSNKLNYTFNYTGQFGFYDIPCKLANTYTHIDGVVDVTVTLRDKCGAVIFASPTTGADRLTTPEGNTGVRHSVNPFVITRELSQGEYQITKEAVINEDKLDAYIQTYLASDCSKKLIDFQAEENAKVNLADCNMTCEKCNAEVDKLLKDDVTNKLLTPEQKEDMKKICASVCDQGVGCTSALNGMKADLSPNGQYAEIYENPVAGQTMTLNPMTDGQTTFTSLNTLNLDPSTAYEGANNPHPELFPLSIYNENNRLPLGSYLRSLAGDIATREYWKYPIKITNSVVPTTPYPKTYQILTDLNNPIQLQGDTKYEMTDYLDQNGDVFYVYIMKTTLPDNSVIYSPEITASSVSFLKPVDATIGWYKIPVKHLKNYLDFKSHWKMHWAYALLPYHPEFPYYVDCISHRASNDFDYLISNLSYQEAVAKGFITGNNVANGGEPNVRQKELDFPGDGGGGNNVAARGIYNAWMNKNIENYLGRGLSLIEFSSTLLHCPNGESTLDPCGTPVTSDCKKITIQTEDEWTTYRALYMSLKHTFVKNYAMFKAVNQNYYNGCIGHPNYISSNDSWYFNVWKPKPQEVLPAFNCSKYGWWKSNCGWKTYGYPAPLPSFLVPTQICNIGNRDYFRNKKQNFFPTGATDKPSGQQAANCPELIKDEDGNSYLSLVPCDTDLIDYSNDKIIEAQSLKYDLCGLCPIASDVESLLMQLTSANKLIAPTGPSISCLKDKITIGNVLQKKILENTSGNPIIYWKSSLTNSKELTASIYLQEATPLVNITLTIPVTNENYTFADLVSVCCLSFPNPSGQQFTLQASFKKNNAFKNVTISGTINLDLKNCSIPPKCVLTNDAINAMDLINVLSGSGQLSSVDTPISLFSDANIERYFDPILSLLKISEGSLTSDFNTILNPVWKTSSYSATNISGTLTFKDGGVDQSIDITIISTADASPEKTFTENIPDVPVQIKNLSTLKYEAGCANCFTSFAGSMISVTNKTFSAKKATITITSGFLQSVKCTTVIPATVNRTYVDEN